MANLAIISDSHNVEINLKLLNIQLKRYAVDTVLHLGDVVLPEMIEYLRGYKTYFVLGNNDLDRKRLELNVESINGVLQEQPLCFDWHNRRIFAVHGHRDGRHGDLDGEELAQAAFKSGEWDLVCYGHTHQYELQSKRTSGTSSGVSWLLNPGALQYGSFCLINDNRFEPQNYDLDNMNFDAMEF